MPDKRYRWRNKEMRDHVAVINGNLSPSIFLKNVTYLNQSLNKWLTANIWIYDDRIVYVGQEQPTNLNGTEIVDGTGQFVVPGYIEPHHHPFNLYNPLSFAKYASQYGTTTFINDNLLFATMLEKKKAFSLIEELNECPVTMYWWCRYDPQTEIEGEEITFSNKNVKDWIEHESVIQGGELTSWPKLLEGDDLILHWMQETKHMRKPIEGHLPGASEKTLTKLKLLGVDADHEAMTGEDVYKRLSLGYTTTLRYSSIRPDLPTLLDEMLALGIDHFDRVLYTMDGSTPSFYEEGVIDRLISIALEKGVPVIDAYNMATYNVAKHYSLDHLLGMIGPGRVANLNFLVSKDNPKPVSVLSKGKWIRRDNKEVPDFPDFNWSGFGLTPLKLDWELTMDDMQFSMPFGMEMTNAVIMKPYSVFLDFSVEELAMSHDESFLMLVDRHGKWRINTMIKGFANAVKGFASSYSSSGDFVLVGKNKEDMLLAFRRMKAMGGGIVLTENGEVLHEIALPLGGAMSDQPLTPLLAEEKKLTKLLRERGYTFIDPIHTLLFFSSTHLPYVRITPKGIFDVMKKSVLFPAVMR